MPLLAGLVIDDRRKLRRLVLEQHEFSALEALAVTRLDAPCPGKRRKLGQIGGRLVAAGAKHGQCRHTIVQPAGSESDQGEGRELGQRAGAQLLVVGTALRSGGNACERMKGDHAEDEIDLGAGAR